MLWKKSTAALGLSAMVFASSLSGCMGSSTGEQPAGNPVSDVTDGTGNQTAKNPLSFWIWVDPALNSLDDTYYWAEIERNTGTDIVWQHPAEAQLKEQFNLIIAGNKLPDIMYYGWQNNYPGGPDAAINDGKIIALNGYIDEYAPNFKAYLDAHPDVKRDISTDSGNIYCFPAIYTNTPEDSKTWEGVMGREPYYETYIGAFVREDWLKDLNMAAPETLDDWYDMLKSFKEEKGARYPLSFVVQWGTFGQTFASAYDVTLPRMEANANIAFGLKEDGTIMYGPAEPGYKDYLAFMNKLYMDGLLDPDFMVQESDSVYHKILTGDTGATVFMTAVAQLAFQARAEDPDTTFSMVGVANPVRTEGQELRYFQAGFPFRSDGAAITTSCTDIPSAMKFLDYLWSEEGNRLINWGIEGQSYEMVDGWPQFTEQYINYILENNQNEMLKNRLHNGPFPMDHQTRIRMKTDYTLPEGETDQILEALKTWEGNGVMPAGLPPTTLMPEESGEYAAKFNEIQTYADEMFAKFIMGQESLDNYDKYVETLYDFGLQDVLDIQTRALERYNNR